MRIKFKTDLSFIEIMIITVVLVIISVMAVPAIKKARETSQAMAISKNLRLLASSAHEYFEEHGVNNVTQSELVGPNKNIEKIESVAGEEYPLILRQGDGLEVVTNSGIRVSITF